MATLRVAVLQAMQRLERRHGRKVFELQDIVQEVLRHEPALNEVSLRTQVTSVMCREAPVHHANHTNDLTRAGRGLYRLVDPSTNSAPKQSQAPEPLSIAFPPPNPNAGMDVPRSELDIERNLAEYLGGREPTSRYTSFDYCFNYFQSHREANRLHDLVHGDALQLSCLHLGFYLASWGMLRGSSELLQRSARSFVPVVEALVAAPTDLWSADADDYSEDATATILAFATTLRTTLHDRASDILVTKILLGTMGCVPAFDTNFKKGFDVATFGHRSLRKVGEFYWDNAEVIEAHREPTLDFDLGVPTERRYTRAKVIDMIFFIEGMP